MRKWLGSEWWLERFPLHKAVIWIVTVTLVISGTAFISYSYYHYLQQLRTNDPKYNIQAVIQCCLSGDELPTGYLVELLQLSSDQPDNLYSWNSRLGEKRLKKSPFIKKALISKIAPDTLKVSYHARECVAVLGDFKNALVDKEAILLPRYPMIKEKDYPILFIGGQQPKWGEKIVTQEMKVALDVMQLIKREFPSEVLESVDASRAYARSSGKRQIVVRMKRDEGYHLLRVTADGYLQQLANYRVLLDADKLREKAAIVIDLRVDHLAYLEMIEEERG